MNLVQVEGAVVSRVQSISSMQSYNHCDMFGTDKAICREERGAYEGNLLVLLDIEFISSCRVRMRG
jgi:hypothetical protein